MKKIILVVLLVFLTGCASNDVTGYLKKGREDLTGYLKRSNAKDNLEIGMNQEDVLKIVEEPGKKDKSITSFSVHEEWTYCADDLCEEEVLFILYFDDEILTAVEDASNF